MATGVIAMYPGAVAPQGWHLCDGTAHGSAALEAMIGSPVTPNLRDKFMLGAGATRAVGSTGGSTTIAITVAQLPNHDHGGATHPENGSHTHAATTASGGSTHAHTGTTGNDSANHTHTWPAVNTGTVSAYHNHALVVNEGGTTDDGAFVDTAPSSDDGVRDFGDSSGQSVVHTHSRPAQNTANPNVNHTHAWTSNAVSVEHTHAVTTAANAVTHTHATTAEGTGSTFSIVPAHVVLSFVIQL